MTSQKPRKPSSKKTPAHAAISAQVNSWGMLQENIPEDPGVMLGFNQWFERKKYFWYGAAVLWLVLTLLVFTFFSLVGKDVLEFLNSDELFHTHKNPMISFWIKALVSAPLIFFGSFLFSRQQRRSILGFFLVLIGLNQLPSVNIKLITGSLTLSGGYLWVAHTILLLNWILTMGVAVYGAHSLILSVLSALLPFGSSAAAMGLSLGMLLAQTKGYERIGEGIRGGTAFSLFFITSLILWIFHTTFAYYPEILSLGSLVLSHYFVYTSTRFFGALGILLISSIAWYKRKESSYWLLEAGALVVNYIAYCWLGLFTNEYYILGELLVISLWIIVRCRYVGAYGRMWGGVFLFLFGFGLLVCAVVIQKTGGFLKDSGSTLKDTGNALKGEKQK